ncbi:MAG: family metallopeptidase [Alphaproteobacteria bacterium]|nr:family metallopeptidase [Alphaproteobacteria bacterium]
MPNAKTNNAGPIQMFRKAFSPIDFFSRGGKALTSGIRISSRLRLALAAAFLIAAPASFSTAQAANAPVPAGIGGTFEAVQPGVAEDASFKALFLSWKKMDQADQSLADQASIAIPSAEPVHGTSFTSGFGVRTDPFRGRAAMHPGIDLAGPIGSPIYATADGTVDRAEWNSGGYGNLVEIDHGHGIQTRYGHLTRYIVAAGQKVKRGDLIAYMGSTGRSTGSHLHYEVRIDGQAVNPVPFLQSAAYLQSVQRRATAMAVGGPVAGSD